MVGDGLGLLVGALVGGCVGVGDGIDVGSNDMLHSTEIFIILL